MLMIAPFDSIAREYDKAFSYTLVGKAQRDIVWHIAAKQLPESPAKVLELNCGTGIDAAWLAEKGHTVTATDVSIEMLEQTRSKTKPFEQVSTLSWDLTQEIPESIGRQDIIFSNFGGLNCLDQEQLRALFGRLNTVLNNGGTCILVFMGRFCLMESLYFTITGKFNSIFRRFRNQEVNITAIDSVETYYYFPRQVKRLLPADWHCIKSEAVGLIVPPSYLNPICARYPRIFAVIKWFDNYLRILPFAAYISDHYSLVIKKKK